jgi:hypothetical protein
VFLTSPLERGEWTATRLHHFTPRERVTRTNWIGVWVGRRARLDAVATREIPTPAGNRNTVIQTVAQSLQWLSSRGSQLFKYVVIIKRRFPLSLPELTLTSFKTIHSLIILTDCVFWNRQTNLIAVKGQILFCLQMMMLKLATCFH